MLTTDEAQGILDLSEDIILSSMKLTAELQKDIDKMKNLIMRLEIDIASKDHGSAVQHLKEAGYLKEMA